MDFRDCIGQARLQTVAAVAELDRYDRTAFCDAPRNRATMDSAIRLMPRQSHRQKRSPRFAERASMWRRGEARPAVHPGRH